MTQPIVVAALYKFVTLEDYVALREPLLQAMVDNGIKGTLLIAEEGINGTVSGSREGIDGLMAWLKNDPRMVDIDHKESYCDDQPFYRTKVKLKKEIVTLGVEGVDPNKKVGTLHKVASTATPLAIHRDFLWRRARRRISAQVRRSVRLEGSVMSGWSYTGGSLQPAGKQRRQLGQRLVAVGQQRQLAMTLGQQGRETGNPQILHPSEIGGRRGVLLGTVEGAGKLDTRYAGLFGQLDQHAGEGHITALDIKRALDQPQQLPRAVWRQAACRDDGAARRLCVIDETVGQRPLTLERLASGLGDRLPVLQNVAPGRRLQRRAAAGAQTAHH
jgi:hypothetical protein